MTDVLGRGVIEIVGDARKLRASVEESKKSIRTLGEGQRDVSEKASRSIDQYITRLQAQNATFGKTAREVEIYKLALRGASNQQIAAADSALRFREVQERSLQSVASLGKLQLGLGIGFVATAGQLIRLSDEYTKYTAQLRLAATSQAEYAKSLEDVRKIATVSQTSLSGVGTLYARISAATKELGIGQKGVADITETVSLALKASGATTAEASSAMLQLSQAFGAGALRGEEFNAVNEAAPRLMRALAEALGVPVGQLKEMASQGQITSEVLARALPTALGDLRKEAQEIQTIAGAFTVLQNKVLEFVGTQAEASGAAKGLASAISTVANNLDTIVAVVSGLITARLAGWLLEAAAAAVVKVNAIRAVTAAVAAEATATAAATAATTANTVATTANAAAKTAQAAATAGAAAAAGTASRVIGLLGGPIGIVTTLLGVGVTAWLAWGNSASKAAEQAEQSVLQTTPAILDSLDKQIAKMEARRVLAMSGAAGAELAKQGGPEAEQLGKIMKEMREIQDAAAASGKGVSSAQAAQLAALGRAYGAVTGKVQRLKAATDDVQRAGEEKLASKWLEKYATDAEKLNAELAKARKELGAAFTPEIERRIRASFAPKGGGAKATAADSGRAADQQLQSDIAQIRKSGEAQIAEYNRAQRIIEARRAANLIDEGAYFESRKAFVDLDSRVQEEALQAEIARLQKETFIGKNAAAERIENDRKIADAEAKLVEVRKNAAVDLVLLNIQQEDSLNRLRIAQQDATEEANAYIDSLRRRNAVEAAGIGQGGENRRRAAELAEIEARFIEQRRRLEAERRRGQITRDVFDTYLALASAAYDKEVELYNERTVTLRSAQSDWLNGAKEALSNYIDEVENVAGQFEETFSRGIRGAEDRLTEFITTGKTDIRSLAQSIQADLNRAFVREQITGPFAKALKEGNILEQVKGILGGGVATQAPAPVVQRDVSTLVGGAAAPAAEALASGAEFTTAVVASGAEFSAAVATAGATFSPEIIAAGAEFSAAILPISAEIAAAGAQFASLVTAAGAEFAATVASSSAVGGSGGGGLLGDVASSFAPDILGSFASGIDYVPKTGLYQLHQGERVVPAAENSGNGGRAFEIHIHQSFAPGTDSRTVTQASVDGARAVQRELARGTA